MKTPRASPEVRGVFFYVLATGHFKPYPTGMIATADLQQLPLHGLEQGHTYTFALTNVGSAVTLQFQHGSDETWRDHPEFTAVAPVAGAVVKTIVCFTPKMRLALATDQTGNPYYATWTVSAQSTF